ncbi:MAG: DEAD/DEAH box helicase [Bacteroidota bacterium]
MTFKNTGLHANLLRATEALGFENPTPIQAKAIPHLLTTDQDLMAFAQTGTGKTAAFGLPTIQQIDMSNLAPQAVVLCPTRELCLQITDDLVKFSKYIKGFQVVAVYGGASIETQIRALKKGAHIVVGTPGRTKDLIKRKKLQLHHVERIILDEADEMLTMGFKEELDAILAAIPEERQTILFSATMSNKMTAITKNYMVNPSTISVAKINIAAKNVEHFSYVVHAKDRYELLKRIADMHPDFYGIVFCRTRRETNEVASKLMQDGYNADTLNGDLSQAQRDEVMAKFRKKNVQILVATDVAARGLDVDDLTHVVNYNLPDDDEVYVHRSGRTGRAGKSGISIAITHTREKSKLRDIERKSGIQFTPQKAPTGKEICTRQLYALIDKIEKVEVDEQQIAPFLPAIYEKLETLSREELIKHFVSAEFNRFLTYYKNARDLDVSDRKKKDRKSRAERRRNTTFSRLFLNVGSKDKLTPARLIGVINEALDSGDSKIGKIEILKKFSFVEIDERVKPVLITALNRMEFEGTKISAEIAESNASKGVFVQKKKKKKSRKKKWEKSRRGGLKRRR